MSNNTIKNMIIGVSKAGTSSLLRYLAQHPDICTHKQDEMNYFVLEWEYQIGYSAAFTTYFNQCGSAKVLLAKSAGLLYQQDAITKLYAHNPDMHLFIMLRHPVDRAYSSFWYEKRKGREQAETFEKALSSKNSRLQVAWRQEANCMYLEQSQYIDYLPFILKTFDREQLHIYLLEDFKKDGTRICQELYGIMGVNDKFIPEIKRHHNSVAKARSNYIARLIAAPPISKKLIQKLPNKTRHRIRRVLASINNVPFSPPPLNLQTRKELLSYFGLYNQQLASLLQRDLSHWDC